MSDQAKILQVRFSRLDHEKLDDLSTRFGLTKSQVVRQLVSKTHSASVASDGSKSIDVKFPLRTNQRLEPLTDSITEKGNA